MPALTPSQVASLKKAMPAGRLLTGQAQMAGYASDGLGYKRFLPDAVAIPANAAEARAVVKVSRELNVPLVARGAGTSLSGGPVAAEGGVILHLSRLRKIELIDAENRYAVIEAGVVLNKLDEALQSYGLYYPPDPSTGPVCTLGGNVASNAGGVHCYRYGVTSNYVLGMEVILVDGTVVQFGGPAGGYGSWSQDWKRLMVGSEGTMGVFTRFWLRLIPLPEKVWTIRATFSNIDSVSQAIQGLATHPAYPAAIEFMDPPCVAMVESSPYAVGLPVDSFMLLTEIDGPAVLVDQRVEAIKELLRACGSKDVMCADTPDQRAALWKARKSQGGLLGQVSPDFIVQDAVIPKRCLAEMLAFIYAEAAAAGIEVVTIMHAGDGNLHPDFLFDSRKPGELEKVEKIGKALMAKVSEMGGTLSGEHGIGNDKSGYMSQHFGKLGEAIQLAIPRAFDRKCQLNPGKVFPARRFEA